MVRGDSAVGASGDGHPVGDRPEVIVTEVRVHGVGGARPHEILNRNDIVPEAGADRIAGFYGTTQDDGPRRIRAYSWGGLTSRKASRALWTLLLPFSFTNVAGWMLEPAPEGSEDEKPELPSDAGRIEKIEHGLGAVIGRVAKVCRASSEGLLTAQRWLVHVVAVTITATYVMWVALLTVDIVGYQCGARPSCYEGRPWLDYLAGFKGEVGRRIALGSLAPIGMLVLFLWLSRRSRKRYDLWRADGDPRAETYGSSPPALTEPAFWRQSSFITNMARVHFGATMTILAGCLSYAMWRFSQTFAGAGNEAVGSWLMIAAGHVFGLALIAIALMLRTPRHRQGGESAVQCTTRVTFWGSIAVMAVTLYFVATLRIDDEALLAQNAHAADLWGFGWLTFGLLFFGVAALMVLTGLQVARWAIDGEIDLGQFLVPVAFLGIAIWPHRWLMATVAAVVIVANLVGGSHHPERDTAGWLPLVVLALVAAPAIRLGSSWVEAAVGVALVVAIYQWAASSRNQETFRWVGTAAVGAVGVLGLTGVLAGITLRLRGLLDLGGFDLQLPAVTDWMALSVFLATVLAWTAGLVYLLGTWIRWRKPWAEEERERWAAHDGGRDDREGDGSKVGVHHQIGPVLWWRAVTRSVRSIDVLITVYAMLLFSAAIAGLSSLIRNGVAVRDWLDQAPGDALQPWVELAAWAELLYVGVAYFAVRSALRDEGLRRRLGMIWDVAGFWPNRYHPFAPPAYAARAVPELIDRAGATPARDGAPNETVEATILSGHSQGSVLCFAAVAALDDEDARRVVLVTHGSPLGSFYRMFFPGVFTDDAFAAVGRKLLASAHCNDGTWINFYRQTDPIGGGLGPVPRDADGPLPGLTETLTEAEDDLPDALLADPCPDGWGNLLQPRVRGHSDYEADPCMARTLDALTALLIEEAGGVTRG